MARRGTFSVLLCLSVILLGASSSSSSAPVAPSGGWVQIGLSGMGDRDNTSATALAPFGGRLYAGTSHEGDDGGAQLWRLSGGRWEPASSSGFGNPDNYGIDCLTEFRSQLYAGTWNEKAGGEMWRSRDGLAWNRVVAAGFGDATNAEVMHLTEFDTKLYASTASYTSTHGAEVWRSGTGDNSSWGKIVTNGFGDPGNYIIPTLEAHAGYLYAGTGHTAGGELWRSRSGNIGDWRQVNANGFGDVANAMITSLASYDSYLYAATHHDAGNGTQVWRCRNCDGNDWTKVVSSGWGNPENRRTPNLNVFDGKLYCVVGNVAAGAEVWRTADSLNWERVGAGGLGKAANRGPYYDSSSAVLDNRLYVGLTNFSEGGAVYLFPAHRVVLPWVVR